MWIVTFRCCPTGKQSATTDCPVQLPCFLLTRKNSTYSIALCPCHTHNKYTEPLPSLVTDKKARMLSTAFKRLFFGHILLVHTQAPACSIPSTLTYLMIQFHSPVIQALHIDMSSVQPVSNHQHHLTIREHHYEQKQCMFHCFLFIYHVAAGVFNKFQFIDHIQQYGLWYWSCAIKFQGS